MVSFNDMADRAPVPRAEGQVIELGEHRVRHIDTPHVPHGWEARVRRLIQSEQLDFDWALGDAWTYSPSGFLDRVPLPAGFHDGCAKLPLLSYPFDYQDLEVP
jgi:hypothetical protein